MIPAGYLAAGMFSLLQEWFRSELAGLFLVIHLKFFVLSEVIMERKVNCRARVSRVPYGNESSTNHSYLFSRIDE
jgi:hypothetical protein